METAPTGRGGGASSSPVSPRRKALLSGVFLLLGLNRGAQLRRISTGAPVALPARRCQPSGATHVFGAGADLGAAPQDLSPLNSYGLTKRGSSNYMTGRSSFYITERGFKLIDV